MNLFPFGSKRQAAPAPTTWQDGHTYGQWKDQFGGYGVIEPIGTNLSMQPEVSTLPSKTSSCLVTSVPTYGDFTASTDMMTIKQLRTGSPPNPWEVAWFLWAYTDTTHFYYVLLKPNGWELGKEDPAYPGSQRFLASGTSPTFPIMLPYAVEVIQNGANMTVNVDGKQLVSFTDMQNPYLSGSVGLYCEDAHVQFGQVVVNGTTLAW